MKTRTTTLLSMAMLALILVGTFALLILGSSTLLIADQVKITPKPFDLENGDDVIVELKLSIGDVPVIDQINPDTILLEGAVAPTNTWTDPKKPTTFFAQFDAQLVIGLLWNKITHMDITRPHPWTPVKIQLKITGTLYDGTEWEGVGEIKVYIPNPGLPPPPPPP